MFDIDLPVMIGPSNTLIKGPNNVYRSSGDRELNFRL